MEKINRKLLSKKKKGKLPNISPNKSNVKLNAKMPDINTSSTLHLKELRKLYYQYKSNANILTHSPYYTNRQHQQNIVSYIEANKSQPTQEQLNDIHQRYRLDPEIEQNIKELKSEKLIVKLHACNVVIEVKLKARTVGELEVALKR